MEKFLFYEMKIRIRKKRIRIRNPAKEKPFFGGIAETENKLQILAGPP